MLAKSPAPGTPTPGGLGVTRGTAFGQPIEVVGPLPLAEHYDLDQPEGSVLA